MTPPKEIQDLLNSIESAASEIRRSIIDTKDISQLNRLKPLIQGKKGSLELIRGEIKYVDPNYRSEVGKKLKEAQNYLESLYSAKGAELVEKSKNNREFFDVTEYWSSLFHETPVTRGRKHPIYETIDELEDIFVAMGFEIAEGPEVETEWNNFEALNIPKHHPARTNLDTFYIKDTIDLPVEQRLLLRAHTSPVQIRLMKSRKPPIYSVMPGKVFRRDTADASHLPVFHQIEGLVVDEGVSFANLAGTIEMFTRAYFGDNVKSRLRPAYFPFTEPSAEFDITCSVCGGEGCRICQKTGWIELGGCGMVNPRVFEHVGIDSKVYSGFAFGFGIERLFLMRYSIEDIRYLVENDVAFLLGNII